MKLEKGRISNSQLMFFVFGYLQCMILTINFAYPFTRQDTWIAVLASFVIAILMTLVYLAVAKKFPGKNLVQINEIVFGPFLGKLISAIYVWFFLELMIHYMYFFNSFWITFIMPETPRAAFLIMFTFVCAMAVRKGLEVIARCSFIFSTVVTLSVLAVSVLLIGDMKPSNLMPVFEVSPMNLVHSIHIILAIPFLDLVAFLMIFPYTVNNGQIAKPVLIGLSLSALELLLVVLQVALVLGPMLPVVTAAPFVVTRLIDIANVLTRLDILYAITLLITVFMKVAVFYYVTVLSFAQTLNLRSYAPLVIPIGAIAIAISANLYESDMEQMYAGMNVWPFNAFLCEVLLPVLTIIIILIRKLPEKEGEKAQ